MPIWLGSWSMPPGRGNRSKQRSLLCGQGGGRLVGGDPHLALDDHVPTEGDRQPR